MTPQKVVCICIKGIGYITLWRLTLSMCNAARSCMSAICNSTKPVRMHHTYRVANSRLQPTLQHACQLPILPTAASFFQTGQIVPTFPTSIKSLPLHVVTTYLAACHHVRVVSNGLLCRLDRLHSIGSERQRCWAGCPYSFTSAAVGISTRHPLLQTSLLCA